MSGARPAAAVLSALALALAGCGAAADGGGSADSELGAGTTRDGITLAEARTFDEFPLLYAGEGVLGHPLVAILRRDDSARYVSFVYGHCEPAGLEGGCAPPVEIQVWPSGTRHAALYDPLARGSPVVEPVQVRGLPAAFVGESQLELYASRSTVVVFSASRGLGLAVAAKLRCLREGATPAGVGALGCQERVTR